MPALSIAGTRLPFGPRSPDERMSHWRGLSPTGARTVAVGIDSVSEYNDFGGVSSYSNLLRDRLNDEYGSRGYGWMPCHRNQAIPSTDEWTVGANWTSVSVRDVNDDAPFATDGRQHAGSTSTSAANLLTLSLAQIPGTVTRFEIVWQDLAGTAGPWAYRIDGGAWVDNPATRVGDGTMKRLLVSSAITSTLDIRPCNAAGTTATACIIDAVSLLNANSTGSLMHLFAMAGRSMSQLTRGSLGSTLSFFSVMDTPDLVILESGNDATTTITTGQEGHVGIFVENTLRCIAAIPTSASLVILTIPPIDHVTYPQRSLAMQTEWAETMHVIGASVGAPVIDIFQEWGGSYAAAEALGFQSVGGSAHSTQAGQQDIYERICAVIELTP